MTTFFFPLQGETKISSLDIIKNPPAARQGDILSGKEIT